MGYMAKHLIIMAIGVEENDDNKTFVYVKGCQKREWLADSNDMTIETLDVDYEDIKSLNNLNITNITIILLNITKYYYAMWKTC